MSEDPESLGITAGAGKLWRLCLLQGTLPTTDAVPNEVDHFGGDSMYCHVRYFNKSCLIGTYAVNTKSNLYKFAK